jgi:hypothetical protein
MSSTLVFPLIPAAVKATWFFAAIICVLMVPLAGVVHPARALHRFPAGTPAAR